MEKTNVIVVVRGGMVSAVYSDGNISVDGYSFFVSADNIKAAWKAAYTCYRAEKNPIPYLRMQFCEI